MPHNVSILLLNGIFSILEDNCLYNSLGWIDDNNDLKVAHILVDAASLPVSVLADFTDASLQQCTETLVEKWQSRPKRKRSN